MSTANWKRTRALLEGALELEPAARAAWLADACAGDRELERDVLALLAAEARAARFEPPESATLSRAFGDFDVGRRIGHYELVERLGEGGMGAVYLARRRTPDFELEVALKLIKRGMDSDDILRQFQRERALLSSLQHEGIARLFDGGATDDGRPWFAMELVRGEPIDAWAKERGLSVRARIELFLRVCAAVQHAHQRLIVHRDLKPSNVLVTAEGTPKLLDFGIAKVLGESSANATVVAERRLTPDYASPEQLRGEFVTTATDVYSLGVVLCELLTGVHPFRGAGDATKARATPPRPSTLVRRGDATARRESLARAPQLDADLDTLVLTALAPETERRYASVDALAADLRRYLDGLPLNARPATASYRFAKFVARNRVVVAAAAAVFVALAVGLAFARAGYVEAVEQRNVAREHARVAERESKRATAVLDLTQRMFAAAVPHDAADKDYTLRELLDDFAPTLEHETIADPEVEASVRQTIGRSYQQIGSLDEAARHLSRALELRLDNPESSALERLAIRRDWIGVMHDRAEYVAAEEQCAVLVAEIEHELGEHQLLASALYTLGELRDHLGRDEQADLDLERAQELADRLDPPDRALEILVLSARGKLRFKARDFAGGESYLQEALVIARAQNGERSSSVAALLASLGSHIIRDFGELDRGEAVLEEALSIQVEVHGERDYRTGPILADLGRAAMQRGNYRRAAELLERALAIARESRGPRHANVAADLASLGNARQRLGEHDAAEKALRESLSIREEVYGAESELVARTQSSLASLLRIRGSHDEAVQLVESALATQRAVNGPRSLEAGLALTETAGAYSAKGDLPRAEAACREALEILREELEPEHPDIGATSATLASILTQMRRFEEAIEMQREAVRIQTAARGEAHPSVANSCAQLGWVLLSAGENEQAAEVLERALALHRAKPADMRATMPRTLLWSGVVAARRGQSERAEELLREALAANRKLHGDRHMHSQEAGNELVKLLRARGENDEADSLTAELALPTKDSGEQRE